MKNLSLALISDTHSKGFSIDGGVDAVLHAGDVTNSGEPWSKSIKSLQDCEAPTYWVKGNHDIGLDNIEGCNNVLESPNFIKDYTIQGVSMSPCYSLPTLADVWCNMTANESHELSYYKKHLDRYYDIVLSHCPPWGDLGTELICGNIGSKCLLDYIIRYEPLLVVCGHIHKPLARFEKIKNTTIINTAQKITYVKIKNEEILAFI